MAGECGFRWHGKCARTEFAVYAMALAPDCLVRSPAACFINRRELTLVWQPICASFVVQCCCSVKNISIRILQAGILGSSQLGLL